MTTEYYKDLVLFMRGWSSIYPEARQEIHILHAHLKNYYYRICQLAVRRWLFFFSPQCK